MSISLTKNYYKVGIIYVIALFFLNVIYGVYSFLQVDPSILTTYILNLSSWIIKLNIWILIRKIFVYKHGQIDLDRILFWIIRLVAIIGAFNILGISYNNPMFSGLIILIGLVNFVLIIVLTIKIWRIEKSEIDTIESIKNYILSMLIISILSVIVLSINDIRIIFDDSVERLNIEYIEYFLKLIPLAFLYVFIKKELRTASA